MFVELPISSSLSLSSTPLERARTEPRFDDEVDFVIKDLPLLYTSANESVKLLFSDTMENLFVLDSISFRTGPLLLVIVPVPCRSVPLSVPPPVLLRQYFS